MRIVPVALFFVLLATASALAQDPSAKPATIAATVNKKWSGLKGDFISAAGAMPEEKYSFAPTQGEFKGARTFAEHVRHVVCSNFAFFMEFSGTQPDPDEDCSRNEGMLSDKMKTSCSVNDHESLPEWQRDVHLVETELEDGIPRFKKAPERGTYESV